MAAGFAADAVARAVKVLASGAKAEARAPAVTIAAAACFADQAFTAVAVNCYGHLLFLLLLL